MATTIGTPTPTTPPTGPAVFDVQAVRHHLQVRLPGKIDQCQNQLLWLNGEHDLLIQIDRSGGRWRD